jgi:penicillin-binding protein 1C
MLEADPNRNRPTVRTTIEKALQVRIERLVADHAATRLRPLGIRNAAAIVAETATGKVRAYVGSQDFFDMENGGQVDGVAALRSPGSLLKPFLYALAMDRGILLPQTKIKDVPTFYGAFSPANANASYDGLVTMKDALVRSLNVPAVRVLYTVGVRPFYLFLAAAGIRSLFRAPEDYGLPLILGGAEVSMWDIAVLFRGLGNAGRFRPLNVVESEAKIDDGAGRPCLISPGACWLTLSVLRELRRPDAETYWELYQNQWPIAWKTGTSYGFRDAWAAGVSPLWTIVVWAGNFNGEGNASLSGAPCAGTLLFAIHNALPKTRGRNWFDPPVEDLDPATLCLETGFLAGAHCPDTQAAEAPRKMKPLMLCPYHRHVFLSKDGTTEVCSACWSPGEVREADRLSFPPEVAQFLRESGKAAKEAPPHNPRCPAYGAEGALALLYPQEGARLWIPRDLDGKLEKVTLRAVHRDRGVLVHWYLDDRYLGATRGRHVKSCLMRKGGHTLHVVDEYGNRASVGFTADLRGNVE